MADLPAYPPRPHPDKIVNHHRARPSWFPFSIGLCRAPVDGVVTPLLLPSPKKLQHTAGSGTKTIHRHFEASLKYPAMVIQQEIEYRGDREVAVIVPFKVKLPFSAGGNPRGRTAGFVVMSEESNEPCPAVGVDIECRNAICASDPARSPLSGCTRSKGLRCSNRSVVGDLLYLINDCEFAPGLPGRGPAFSKQLKWAGLPTDAGSPGYQS